MSQLTQLKQELEKLRNPRQAEILQRFFKTGKGEYGQGDVFLGIKVPICRKTAHKYKDLCLEETVELLHSKIHEHRLIALVLLINKFQKADVKTKEAIYRLYLKNTRYINNWDLVDLSAPKIPGSYLLTNDRKILYRLARSSSLWERRISIMATFAFIKTGQIKDTLKLAEILVHDNHDIIHKAVGWMLREVGNRASQKEEEAFLKRHYKTMPRTMLRYAIEKFDEKKRKYYLAKK